MRESKKVQALRGKLLRLMESRSVMAAPEDLCEIVNTAIRLGRELAGERPKRRKGVSRKQ